MLTDDAKTNEITRTIIGAAIEVHRILGPGLLESVYLTCLEFELHERGLRFVVQRSIPITYKGKLLDGASYRVDLIVEEQVIVEVKSVAAILPIHEAQALTYLRLTSCRIALLINFNVPRLVDGVRRLINTRVPQITEITETRPHHRDTEVQRTRREDGGSTGRPAQLAD